MENQNQEITQAKPKKSWYKKWWIWVIIGVGVCGIVGAFMPKDEKKNDNKSSSVAAESTAETTSSKEKTTEKDTEAPTEKATETPKKNADDEKDDFIKSCGTIDYKTLARNPDKYKGNNYKITGQVIQVMDSDSWFDDSTTLRINITAEKNEYADGGYLWSDTIVASVDIPDGADRILEDDIIDFYGTCEGLYTYESILGQKISLPRIDIKYYSIHE